MRYATRVDVIRASHEELEALQALQIRYHFRSPAVFSCNRRGEIWVFRTYGYTPLEDRVDVSETPILRRIARAVLGRRPRGGRFFVSPQGVYTFLDDDESPTLIAVFQTSDSGSAAPQASRNPGPSSPAALHCPLNQAQESLATWYLRMRKRFGDLWDSD
jgi:hypothetical protein